MRRYAHFPAERGQKNVAVDRERCIRIQSRKQVGRVVMQKGLYQVFLPSVHVESKGLGRGRAVHAQTERDCLRAPAATVILPTATVTRGDSEEISGA